MKNLPTAFQRNTLWTAITAFSITLIGALAIGFIYLGTQVIGFLQPILMPFAVAGVLAYLLDPGVAWLEQKRGLTRQRAVLIIFATFSLVLFGLGWWIVPKIVEQTSNLASKVPGYTIKARTAALDFATKLEREYGIPLPEPLAELVHEITKKDPVPKAAAASGGTEPPRQIHLRLLNCPQVDWWQSLLQRRQRKRPRLQSPHARLSARKKQRRLPAVLKQRAQRRRRMKPTTLPWT